jgi:hypothetical protein
VPSATSPATPNAIHVEPRASVAASPSTAKIPPPTIPPMPMAVAPRKPIFPLSGATPIRER